MSGLSQHKSLALLSPRRAALWLCALGLVMIFSAACGGTAGEPIAGQPTAGAPQLAPVESIAVQILESFPVQVRVIARGTLPDECSSIGEVLPSRVGNQFHIAVFMQRAGAGECSAQPVPFEQSIPLAVEGLPAGNYLVDVNGVTDSFSLAMDNSTAAVETEAQPPTETPPPPPTATPAIPEVAYVVQGMLASELGVSPADISIEDVVPQDWPDSCLGLAQPADEACLQQIIPGYAIVLGFEGQTYLYRSDREGQIIRLQTPTVVLTPTATPLPITEGRTPCRNEATFITDVTVKDATRIAADQRFVKTWRLQNTGTCTWTPDYLIVWTGGAGMAEQATTPLGQSVAPGDKVDISVVLKAPAQKGRYKSSFMLETPAGQRFGIGRRGQQAFWVSIIVPEDTLRPASIEGTIWHDQCANAGLSAESPPPGCQIMPDGSFLADGQRGPDEPAIGGAIVELQQGQCPGTPLSTTVSDATGFYAFTDLPPGDYCVRVDPLSDHNAPIFLPGEWSYPLGGEHSITVGPAETRKEVNFGWDYQFSP